MKVIDKERYLIKQRRPREMHSSEELASNYLYTCHVDVYLSHGTCLPQ